MTGILGDMTYEGTKLPNFEPIDKVDELQKIDTEVGTGEEVQAGATVTVHYTGALCKNGIIFQSSHDMGRTISFPLSGVIAAPNAAGQRFTLTGGGGDAWARDKAMDAAIVAAMRSAESMTVSARDARGRAFWDTYRLAGAATAMDAASVGCARLR